MPTSIAAAPAHAPAPAPVGAQGPMEQDPSSPASRDRAVSSEPCSTRPNPFDESDLSARKRRRTSQSGSSSKSLEFSSAQEYELHASTDTQAAVNSTAAMRIDSPETAVPSTPPASCDSHPDPVSSKVTINLRNGSIRNDPASSPASPLPTRVRTSTESRLQDDQSAALEPVVQEISSMATSAAGSPEEPVIIPDDDDDVLLIEDSSLTSASMAARLIEALRSFPYFAPPDDTYYDTFLRLHQYLHQGAPDPDDIFRSLLSWMENVLLCTSAETFETIFAACQENQSFWLNLPELFFVIWRKYSSSNSTETFGIVHDLMQAYAKLTAFLLAMDCDVLSRVANANDANQMELYSPNFMFRLANVAHRDEQLGVGGNDQDVWAVLAAFRPGTDLGPGLALVVRLAELLTITLPRFPRKSMDCLVKSSALVEALIQATYQKRLFYGADDQRVMEKSQMDMALALKIFHLAWTTTETAADKFASHLPTDSPSTLLSSLCEILRVTLICAVPEVQDTLKDYAATHAGMDEKFVPEAITLERKFQMLEKLVRSQQMQLRVSAVSVMCNELVGQWRRYQEQNSNSEADDGPHFEFLRYFSTYLLQTGIVDYFLGPSCHPEIIIESANIIGFLMVTKTYTQVQTDLLWKTISTSRDPRISDALIRMMLKVPQLCDGPTITAIFEKLRVLPIESFNAAMRELFDVLMRQVYKTMHSNPESIMDLPRQLCLRLIQESSVFATQGTLAYPDIFTWAYNKLKEIIIHACPTSSRQELFLSCRQDILAKSRTTHGSLQVLFLLTTSGTPLQSLIAEHDFVQLLVDELETAIANARAVGFSPVYATPFGPARRRFISNVFTGHGSMISKEIGQKLWNLLVGPQATCHEDVKAAWDDLNGALKRSSLQNEFLKACLEDYLPKLPPACFCAGSLEFVRETLMSEVNDPNSTIFDEKQTMESHSLEILWQMVLKAPNRTIEDQAIHILVGEVYVGSATIKAFPLDRARKVHFSLAKRCLHQLKIAAEALQSLKKIDAENTSDVGPEPESPEQTQEHELHFTRSLRVVKDLLRSLKDKSHFSAPDIRSLILQTPSAIDGDLADLKYQAFDGEEQTDIKPLTIGLSNTGASLLASLREATGFENYRLYYRGQPLAPSSDDICKSIQDLEITNGLILVRKEPGESASPSRIRPGASPLEIEVLRYFKDLWEYLSMEEKLASEIYQFLVRLPADDSILATFEDLATSHRDIFPIGQPFKALYAIHALREYLDTHRLRNDVVQTSGQDMSQLDDSASDHRQALLKALTLLVSALCDPELAQEGLSESLSILLKYHLVDNYVQILKESSDVPEASTLVSADLCNMMVQILDDALRVTPSLTSSELVKRVFEAMLESSDISDEFWNAFKAHAETRALVKAMILEDDRAALRKGLSSLLSTRSAQSNASKVIVDSEFAAFFWPIVLDLLPDAVRLPSKCEDVFHLLLQLLQQLAEAESPALDLTACLERCGQLLLSHTTAEDITKPDTCDPLSHGLVLTLSLALKHARAKGVQLPFEPRFSGRLFLRHLFPPSAGPDSLVPSPIINVSTRNALYEIIFSLNEDTLWTRLLKDLDGLTPFDEGSDSPYLFELPQFFDRQKAVRSPCGYAGLRNLSNTCYLNSLITQLFMNNEFRRFILSARTPDSPRFQLLRETQLLFAALQDSRRRFIDPQSCVGHILTYDETPIDIHNQMDVDEFYNLLFDRWEAQMPSEVNKKRLRSIFGGELVQQVKSKECDHISERFEDFSAIQCDIKGKASLEESLQAYVDGEIMEGENKYKCSSCDRFVDAVKRACFKTLPNNLIFHLKRFDFNLRTMTRAKINDHFRFPKRIDMNPYTVQHLANLSDASQPDVFELVGVLVHSGSAESGHYYSFIRERPTAQNGEKWVEFNDDVVTPWDPCMMEDACFGGLDNRPPFDGGPHEKVYSAYMLFYQRASTLEEDQRDFSASDQPSPFRCQLPPALADVIREENTQILHRHCLYDPYHVPFVMRVLGDVWQAKCLSDDHVTENLAIQVGLGHLDQVASRAKEVPDFQAMMTLLHQTCQRCPRCSIAFFDYFRRRPEALIMLLQKNPFPTVRHEIGRTLMTTLRSLKKHYPEEYGLELFEEDDTILPDNVITQTVDLFARLWEQFHVSLRSWPEYFGTMLEFARLGHLEATALLQANFLIQVAAIITLDAASEISTQYARLATTLSRRMVSRPPNYENIIALIDVLLSAIDPEIDTERIAEIDDNRIVMAYEEDTVPFTSQEINLLHGDWGRGRGNVFVDKLIQINQNETATDSIIRKLLGLSRMMDNHVFTTLRIAITGQIVHYLVAPYLRVALVYCRFSQNHENARRLQTHVSDQCANVQNAEARSFFEFQKQMYLGTEDIEEQSRSLLGLSKWVPGLLGHIDHTVSQEVCQFLQETLLKFGPSPNFNEAEGGSRRSKVMDNAAKRLCLTCLIYLRDNYVVRGVPAARDTVLPILQVIDDCSTYFGPEGESEDLHDTQFHQLCQTVLGPMTTLTVDEIEEDGSDWENSVGSSEQMNSLEELSMQIANEGHEVG